MSGTPYPEGVRKLAWTAVEQRNAGREVLRLKELIRECEVKLLVAESDAATKQREVIQQLKSMDCAANQNMGWEGRIVWMLAELAATEPPTP